VLWLGRQVADVQLVRVRVPATSANLGPGFDAFGLALRLHDVVRAQVIESGLRIEVRGAGEETAGLGDGHLVVRAMRAAFDVLGVHPPGLALACDNAVPHGFGLGSSAAAIVGGLLAARALAGDLGLDRLPDADVLRLATELEGHADNVAACLAGGLTIAWTSGGSVRAASMAPMPGLVPVLCVPPVPLSTEVARKVLPSTVPHADAACNAARAGLLVAALRGDAALLFDATEDFLHQPYRAGAMPATTQLIGALRGAGVPAVVSGAGPTVLALLAPPETPGPEVVSEAVAAAGAGAGAGGAAGAGAAWTVRVLEVDLDGATVEGNCLGAAVDGHCREAAVGG
jgi:homoserine kinase